MTPSDLQMLPPDARLWVFGSDRALTPEEASRLTQTLNRFIGRWTAHSAELTAVFTLLEDRFVLVAVDESRAAASGCSIDTLIRQLEELEHALDIRLLDGRLVWYRDESGAIVSCDREEFRRLGQEGQLDGQTGVFDLTLDRLGGWRSGLFERPAADSWHASLLTPSGAGARARPV
jgi:hypothetical protein